MKKFLIFLIVAGVLVAGAWKLGWVGVTDTSNTTIISIDKDKAKEDMNKAGEKVKEAGEKMKDAGEKAVEKVKELGGKAAEKVKDAVGEEKKTGEK